MPRTAHGEALAARAQRRRAAEGIADSVAASGAVGGYGDEDGYRYRGSAQGGRPVPNWTLERARMFSVHAYRVNPMARAIIDTVTAFAVGDTGVRLEVGDPAVRVYAERFWRDPRNRVADLAETLLRGHLLNGETALELLVGETTGVTRFSYVNPAAICRVAPDRGNPLWPGSIHINHDGTETPYAIAWPDDFTGLRTGAVLWRADWRALPDDMRGFPYLGPDLDWLEAYDRTLWNLVDRTALARYFMWDVTVEGDDNDVKKFIADRTTMDAPRSGTIEVHNGRVKWDAKSPTTGAYEDRATSQQILTSIAAGAGLSKVWLAEPEDANRATSITMAEPVRRRVGSVQRLILDFLTELARYAVDQGVAARRIPGMVTTRDEAGHDIEVPAAETVRVFGPEIAAADAQVNAGILLNLATGLAGLTAAGALSEEAARLAARKAWEDYMGVPYRADLDSPDTESDELADYVDDQAQPKADQGPAANLRIA